MTKEGSLTVKTLETQMSMADAWGRPRTVTVRWVPEDVTGPLDANIGWRRFAHDSTDDPPVYLSRHSHGFVDLRAHVRRHTDGGVEIITEFRRVDRAGDLRPGTYLVEDR